MNLILLYATDFQPDGGVCLCDGRAAHIIHVLRASVGKTLRVGMLNGAKGVGTVQRISDGCVELHCEFESTLPARPPVDLILALPRPKVMKRLWAQVAALGVGRIFLTNAEKVERYYFDSHVLSPEFYTAQLIEGLQQSGDTLLPEVEIVKELKPFIEDRSPVVEKKFVADPSASFSALDAVRAAVSERTLLAIGPEGGWTPYELDLFFANGFSGISMGSRILRTDTACVALLSLFALQSPDAKTEMD